MIEKIVAQPMKKITDRSFIHPHFPHLAFQFGGNPVSCAIGMAVLDVIKNEQLMSGAKFVGRALVEGFKNIQDRHPMMGQVR